MFEDPHVVLDKSASLRRHHLAKREIREDQLTHIPMKANAQVLDVGSGPGLYLNFWLQFTKAKNVHFTLLDHSQESLDEAAETAKASGDTARLSYLRGDFYDLNSVALAKYDVVFVGNCVEYMPDPVGYLRTQLMPLLNPGGVIAIRDLDCGFVNCNLVDPALNHKIVGSRIRNCQASKSFHNPFLGRDLGRFMYEAGLIQVESRPYFVEFRGPLTEVQKAYLYPLHTNWYTEDFLGLLTPTDIKIWQSAFDIRSPQSPINSPEFYYVEAEYLAVGRLGVDKT